ncbi:insulin-like peptide INSL6 [Otolemur garnettii]|uniref:insulin-like peptide INSL6 n=1 Tax=Otolemur garnettii TaxID=30611 RepID=UPI0001514225|nr:insulin-like peptide INSL6 [Otolemur garnettii]
MPRLLSLCLLWLGVLLARFSHELNDSSRARKLCGRHLMEEIVKLCGRDNWSQFHLEEEIPFPQLISKPLAVVETFTSHQFESPVTLGKGRITVSTSVSHEEANNTWEMQSLPGYQYKKVNSPLDKTREFSSSHVVNPRIRESIKSQKKSTNKIKTLNNLFWGNHPQRKRRGYSEKCCLKGCTKEELSIACLPYVHFKNVKQKGSSLVTEIY